jgi:hypothetical protein
MLRVGQWGKVRWYNARRETGEQERRRMGVSRLYKKQKTPPSAEYEDKSPAYGRNVGSRNIL